MAGLSKTNPSLGTFFKRRTGPLEPILQQEFLHPAALVVLGNY